MRLLLFTLMIWGLHANAEPIVEVTPGASDDVLYYFHGGGAGVEDAIPDLQSILEKWERPPTIVSVSYGAFWVYNVARPELAEFEKIRARVESKRPRRRLLYGLSMGGFNALQVLINQPGIFDRAALVAPMLLPIGPYATDAEIADFSSRSGVPERSSRPGGFAIRELLEFLRTQYTAEEWARVKLAPPTQVPLLVSISPQDIFFVEGTGNLVRDARSRGCAVQLSEPYGGHSARDDQAIVDFFKAP